MEILHTETNRGKKSIIVDGYIEKWRYSAKKKCNKLITTDPDGVAIVKTRNEHCCGKEPDPRGIEARQLRVRVRHKTGDITNVRHPF